MLERFVESGEHLLLDADALIEFRRCGSFAVEAWQINGQAIVLRGVNAFGEHLVTPSDVAIVDKILSVGRTEDASRIVSKLCRDPQCIVKSMSFSGSIPIGGYWIRYMENPPKKKNLDI